jgi:transposase-like protein
MDQRIVVRYSMSFKRHVVEELESGRFSNISEVQKHYGIAGTATVRNWLVKYGRNHLCAKVVRVEKPNEKNQILQLKRQIKQLKEALGQTQAENVINQEFLKIACEQLGKDLESFKKKAGTELFTKPKNSRRQT